jgi:hypothetical protein
MRPPGAKIVVALLPALSPANASIAVNSTSFGRPLMIDRADGLILFRIPAPDFLVHKGVRQHPVTEVKEGSKA